jgi:hypothetical protein
VEGPTVNGVEMENVVGVVGGVADGAIVVVSNRTYFLDSVRFNMKQVIMKDEEIMLALILSTTFTVWRCTINK